MAHSFSNFSMSAECPEISREPVDPFFRKAAGKASKSLAIFAANAVSEAKPK